MFASFGTYHLLHGIDVADTGTNIWGQGSFQKSLAGKKKLAVKAAFDLHTMNVLVFHKEVEQREKSGVSAAVDITTGREVEDMERDGWDNDGEETYTRLMSQLVAQEAMFSDTGPLQYRAPTSPPVRRHAVREGDVEDPDEAYHYVETDELVYERDEATYGAGEEDEKYAEEKSSDEEGDDDDDGPVGCSCTRCQDNSHPATVYQYLNDDDSWEAREDNPEVDDLDPEGDYNAEGIARIRRLREEASLVPGPLAEMMAASWSLNDNAAEENEIPLSDAMMDLDLEDTNATANHHPFVAGAASSSTAVGAEKRKRDAEDDGEESAHDGEDNEDATARDCEDSHKKKYAHPRGHRKRVKKVDKKVVGGS